MSSRFESLLASPPSGRSRPLLLDASNYATRVLRQGNPIPWHDLAALSGVVGQVHALLDPDTTWLDVSAIHAGHVAGHPDLVRAMGARSRTGYALRTLLGDDAAVEYVTKVGQTLFQSTGRPLILSCPSPGRWLALVQEAAGKPVLEVNADAADTASMFVAEWLGKLGELPVAAVIFDARPGQEDALVAAEALSTYTAVTNVAAYLDWPVALRGPQGVETTASASFSQVPPDFWSGSAPILEEADVLLADLPSDALPEAVLEYVGKIQ